MYFISKPVTHARSDISAINPNEIPTLKANTNKPADYQPI